MIKRIRGKNSFELSLYCSTYKLKVLKLNNNLEFLKYSVKKIKDNIYIFF